MYRKHFITKDWIEEETPWRKRRYNVPGVGGEAGKEVY